jgi:hypothetical protein
MSAARAAGEPQQGLPDGPGAAEGAVPGVPAVPAVPADPLGALGGFDPEAPQEVPAVPEGSPREAAGDNPAPATRQARAPWHFKVILVGSVVYLGWRAYQGISWLAHHIH